MARLSALRACTSFRSRPVADIKHAALEFRMSIHTLYFPALVIAVVGGVIVAVGAVYPSVGFIVRPVTYVCAAAILVLFLRMLFDPGRRHGIRVANREMHGDPLFPVKWPKLSDSQWGLFGSRIGDKSLLFVRAVLFCEFGVAMLFSRVRPDLTLLAAASFGVAIMLSLLHVGLKQSATDSGVG